MAAGSGSRFGEKKQFKLLKGIALYFYSLNKFLLCKDINEIILVVPENRVANIKKEVANIKKTKKVLVVSGGYRRQYSVKNGLLFVNMNSVSKYNGISSLLQISCNSATLYALNPLSGLLKSNTCQYFSLYLQMMSMYCHYQLKKYIL